MPETTVEQAIQIAVQHHQAGRMAEAEGFYRQVLAIQPKHADALHLLGVVAAQTNRHDLAIKLIREAIAVNPSAAEFYSNLGKAYQAKGRPHDAMIAYNNLGNLLGAQRRFDEAVEAYRTAIRLDPNYAGAHYNMGIALWEKGEFDKAIDAYRQALRIKPDFDSAYNNLGNALKRMGRVEEAIDAYRKALSLNANYPDAQTNLGVSLLEKGFVDEAIAAHSQAIQLEPQRAQFRYNLGVALAAARRFDDAIDAYRHAIRLDPNSAEAHYNLGHIFGHRGELDTAVESYERAIQLKPQWPEPHYNLALTLLLQENFERGWTEYEWRWGAKDFPSRLVQRGRPQWDGSNLEGKTILLHAEQGLGDTVQFIRYAPLVAKRGGRVMVECAPDLARLIASVEGVAEVVTKYPPPPFDVHCPLLSLPGIFATRVDSIPADVPYVRAEPDDVKAWAKQLTRGTGGPPVSLQQEHGRAAHATPAVKSALSDSSVGRALPAIEPFGGQCPPYTERSASVRGADPTSMARRRDPLRIGLAWAGQPSHKNDRNRSMSLSQLGPLAHSTNATFYSLQKGSAAAEAARPPARMNLVDWTAEIRDLADTAALMSHMDLIITVDTVVAHLAGALGKPVWVMLPNNPDWRWMRNREDSPWYPTMRLFRQNAAGDKAEVIARMAQSLERGEL
jgi:tetratricopeptide (TPR) repeat protein